MLLSDMHLNQRVPTSDGTDITRPYESLFAPLDQRMLWSDIWMNQAEMLKLGGVAMLSGFVTFCEILWLTICRPMGNKPASMGNL